MKKWWIGFGEYANFSKKDRAIFLVVPADGNRERQLDRTSFVEAEDMAESRRLLKAEVDKYFDHMEHMAELERLSREPKPPPPPPVVEEGGTLRIL